MLTLKERTEFMQRLADEHPNPKSELNYTTPYELIVAVALSAQSTDKGVNIATAKLFPVANTAEKLPLWALAGLFLTSRRLDSIALRLSTLWKWLR